MTDPIAWTSQADYKDIRYEYSGTGIGLAMCRKIVEFHGGEIRLEPESADGGASFRFTLPVPEKDAPA